MPDSPVPAVFNLDFSKTVPRGALDYLSALIPGLFFEISILLSNPQLISGPLAQVQQAVPLKPYLQLALALFIAFIIGSASMFLVGFIQYLLTYVHDLRMILTEEFARWPLPQILRWLSTYQFFRSHLRFQNFCRRATTWSFENWEIEQTGGHAWSVLAKKLIHDRHGIDVLDVPDAWSYLFWSIGTTTAVEWRGPMLTVALEATGWCGLLATKLAPVLRSRYYFLLCAIFIVIGLMNDYRCAARRADPRTVIGLRIRALLREYEKDRRANFPDQKAPANPDEAD